MPRAELAGLFEMLRSAPQGDSIAEMRANMNLFTPFVNANAPDVARVESAVALGGVVNADIIIPPGAPPFPTLIYLHGGGWSIGSPASHAKLTRQLSVGAGVVVVSVDYRLAPEHPFPTPLDDCAAAARWTRANIARWGGDPARIAIGGDSAGGNLSAAVVNDLRGDIEFRGAVLIYGAFDVLGCYRHYDRWAPEEDPVLPKKPMKMMLDAYFSGGASNDDPRVSPLKADLSRFPPACLICGTWDPLFGDSLAFYEKLCAAGRQATLHRYEGMPHAFVQLPVSDADAAIGAACQFLNEVLA
jgi:acetyl esterase/lipase